MRQDKTLTETTKTNAQQLNQIRITNVNNADEITISGSSQRPGEKEVREAPLRVVGESRSLNRKETSREA